jgi:bifunctional enzyme CysN/CysC
VSVLTREQMNIVIVGHVDHGKSTVVGRLFADTGSLPEGKLAAVRAECARTGKVFEYAFLLDALSDEQDQGITIDTARCFFKTERRDYVIIDAPGHIEFLKNMISGAARAEAAVLVIDAKEGVRENSRRHGWLLGMLGVRQVVVCVNKMDLVGWSETAFAAIEAEYRAFLAGIGAPPPARFIPIAALHGDNLAKRGSAAWYRGPTLLETLDGFAKAASAAGQPLRMPVQAVYKFTDGGDDRRIVAGRIDAGEVAVGDEVVFSPSNKRARIRSIEAFNAPARQAIGPGLSTGFTLDHEIYITRGELMSRIEHAPRVATRFRANLVWLGRKPMEVGRDYKLKLHAAALPVRIGRIHAVRDASTLDPGAQADRIGRHEVADLELELRQPVAFDLASESQATGRFVIVDGWDIAGGGIITEAVADAQDGLRLEARLRDFRWLSGGVSVEERRSLFHHAPALVLFTGRQGVGKHRFARALERSLFQAGCAAYLLDAGNVLLGVGNDLAADAARHELVRRFGELAHLLTDAGLLVVSTSNSFALADHTAVRTLLGDRCVLTVDIDPAGGGTAECDLRFTGRESEAEVVAGIRAWLRQRGVIGLYDASNAEI